ncbi:MULTISPECIES: MGMT family protein [Acinetobacter]|uniref:MGMT family protein n=1 Tax=Acinetobacter wuhouensis TaxID=1879050 RepID=A0A3G2T525_9GAMM|nr:MULTISPECIES: MGMT family protein [Acinetobacter]AYO55171.1 MGMT family protein [Acinetobacter wuhouensis]RZG45985.1 MGMT family protein [Acinetobacter wuhouensis]RZG72150.1 MGMT family protein [Acinetobacter wuhouensis]RZG72311.1 MGMT family protein [Acinetobacter sp. WCHAc060025]RZG82129.1 MGMT family protein [Acinetobacter sp. WCHAc060033]
MSNPELAQMILNVIVQIPKSKVASYGQIASLAGLPKHARLVGKVLGQLPSDHDIPWYRVINSQGRISLNKLDEKGMCVQTAKLLEEGVVVINGKVNLKQFQWKP